MILRSLSAREETGHPKVWLERHTSSPEGLMDIDDNDGAASCLSSFSYPHNYQKLSQKYLLRLYILKLDGSIFDVHVKRHATVVELKQAIEDVFCSLSTEDINGKISWPDVWDHFCLCYKDQKLLNNRACIRSFGIKDGDQLRFTRHMVAGNGPACKQTKQRREALRQNSISLRKRYGDNRYEIAILNDNGKKNGKIKYIHYEDQDDDPLPELKFSNCLRGWFFNSGQRSKGSSKMHKDGTIRSQGYHQL